MSVIKILTAAIIFKAIVWTLLVPLWHTPDEQAHFGHVAFIAEGNDLARHGRYPDMNEEIYRSLDILGTKRDEFGNNKFTFHPEYRLPYSSTLTGPEEAVIKKLPVASRQNLVIRESAYYPHFYYQISSLIYHLFYAQDLFVRVFAVRLFWLLAHLTMMVLIYQIAKEIFPKDRLMIIGTTVITSMQPMLSFVSAGVTSDNLHNLLFTAVIYLGLKILSRNFWLDWLAMALVIGLGLINKQQFLLALVIVLPVIIYRLIITPKITGKFLLIMPVAGLIAWWLAPQRMANLAGVVINGSLPYLSLRPEKDLVLPDYSIGQHFIWTINHTIKEVLPWYWGVFNWLGVVLPRWVNRVMMRLLVISGLGLIIYLWRRRDKKIIFLLWTAVAYFGGLLIWDWTFIKNNGFSFGLQGRYYFPVIGSHLVLFVLGIRTLHRLGLLLLSWWFLLLNWLALYLVASSYYDTAHPVSFIIQASQYKPDFAKGYFLAAAIILYMFASLLLAAKLVWLYRHEK